MKKKIFLIVSIITLGFFISFNAKAQDVNLDSLVASNNYNSKATKLIITSNKNLDKISKLNMPNLVQVNISGINITNSSLINFNKKIKLLYLKNVVINMDGINDSNIERLEIRHTYIYGNSSKTKNYERKATYSPKYIEDPAYNNQINKIAQSIYKNGMSKEDIIREVTLYVTNHLTYNLSVVNNGRTSAQNIFSGQGVCSEYAYFESQLLNKLGIYTLTMYGYPVDRSVYHAWNVVYLNNNWYTIDPTWLDTQGNNNVYSPSSERFKNYYLRPLSANIYKPDFTLLNMIPSYEKNAKSIISYTQTTTKPNTSTNNTQTTTKPNTSTNNTQKPNTTNNNTQTTTKPNTNTNTNTNTNNTQKPNTTNNNTQTTTKPNTSTNNTQTTSKPSTSTNNNQTTSKPSTSTNNTQSTSKPSTSTNNNQTTTKPSTSTNNTQTTTKPSTSTNNTQSTSKPSTSTNNNQTETNTNSNKTSEEEIDIYIVKPNENNTNEVVENYNNVPIKEETNENEIVNNKTPSQDEQEVYVEVPNTSKNNIIFIIIGSLITSFSFIYINTKKEN